MSKLTEQDQANINRISELLAELKPLIYGVSHLIDQDCYNPYAPIAPVEPNTIAQTEPIKEESKYSVFIGKNEGNYEVLVLGIENRDKAHWISYKIKQLLKEL